MEVGGNEPSGYPPRQRTEGECPSSRSAGESSGGPKRVDGAEGRRRPQRGSSVCEGAQRDFVLGQQLERKPRWHGPAADLLAGDVHDAPSARWRGIVFLET